MNTPNRTWMAWIFTLLAVMAAQIAGTSLYCAFWFVRPVYITVQPPTPPSTTWAPEAEISRLKQENAELKKAHAGLKLVLDHDLKTAQKVTDLYISCLSNTFPEGKR